MKPGRREFLARSPNPATAIDYINKMEGRIPEGQIGVSVRYVPDKAVVTADSFLRYLESFDTGDTRSLEELAVAILDDFNNEIVPRWVQVRASRMDDKGPSQEILVEDRQPKWDNPSLLARLDGL